MKEVRLRCKKCGERFQKVVLEKGEAKERKVNPNPVRCPKCNSTEIVRE